MRIALYKLSVYLSKKAGSWLFDLVIWFAVTGHFLLFPSRVSISIRFYRKVFPGRSWFSYLACAWRQFHNFGKIFKNRLLIHNKDIFTYSSEGMEHLDGLKKEGKGGIILMSHVGNWEIAAQLLSEKGLEILLFMGVKNREQLEKMQKDNLSESGVKIIAVEKNDDSPYNILEGLNFIKNGGIVSITGDRSWGDNKRVVPVTFFDHTVMLPEAPHLFALLTGAPIYIFFSVQTGKNSYYFRISEPYYVQKGSRKERRKELQKSAQHYADILQETVRKYPLQWYHFEEFLDPAKSTGSGNSSVS